MSDTDLPPLSPDKQWLVDTWNGGASAGDLARLTGRTRNACLGTLHRLKDKGYAIVERSSGVRRPAVAREPKIRQPPPAKEPKAFREIEVPLDPELAVTVEDAKKHHCRWPLGDPAEEDFRYCGRQKFGEHPYCEGHCRKAYQPRGARRDKDAA